MLKETMTTDNKTQLTKLLLPLLAVLVGFLLSSVVFVLAMRSASACQCVRPIAITFPYAAISWGSGRAMMLGNFLFAFQFPVYGVLIAIAKSKTARRRSAVIILVVHVVAAAIGLLVYKT
jgi:hypothetical protein